MSASINVFQHSALVNVFQHSVFNVPQKAKVIRRQGAMTSRQHVTSSTVMCSTLFSCSKVTCSTHDFTQSLDAMNSPDRRQSKTLLIDECGSKSPRNSVFNIIENSVSNNFFIHFRR